MSDERSHQPPPDHYANSGFNNGIDPDWVPESEPQDQDYIDGQARELANIEAMELGVARILLPEGSIPADAIQHLSKKVPLNAYQLPEYFFRSDILPYDLGLLTQGDADAATITLDYSEGYPAYAGGKIFWYQLPHEPLEAFMAFERYLHQPEETGLRQLEMLAMDNRIALKTVNTWFREYMWSWRARAYDLFQVAAERKKRYFRSLKAEQHQYDNSTTLIDQLMEKFRDPAWINGLSPSEAIESLNTLVKIQRMALGLSANGMQPKDYGDPAASASAEQMLKGLTKDNEQVEQGNLGVDANLSQLLMDPRFALEAQALVLKVRRGDVESVSDATKDTQNREQTQGLSLKNVTQITGQ